MTDFPGALPRFALAPLDPGPCRHRARARHRARHLPRLAWTPPAPRRSLRQLLLCIA